MYGVVSRPAGDMNFLITKWFPAHHDWTFFVYPLQDFGGQIEAWHVVVKIFHKKNCHRKKKLPNT